jgi:hypothetical protein
MSLREGQHVAVAHEEDRAWIAGAVRAELARYQKLQAEAAAVLDLPQQSVSDRLLGKTPFRGEELAKLADWLGISIARFLTHPERVA